jgi:uncharacterized phiE125 gp8 family phage protein
MTRVPAVLLVGPTAEPLTADELKARARHNRTDEDALLPGFIAAARQQVECDTERALLSQTWRASVATGGIYGLSWPPLQAVTTVTQSLAGVVTTLDPSLYTVDLPSGVITLPVVEGTSYVIDYVAGAADVTQLPPLLVQAVGILAVHYLTLGRDLASSVTLVPVPQNYLDAVQPFRAVSV